MARWKLTLEYDGGRFAGWQRQENGLSIQASLEEAIFKFCGETATVSGAGRTDAGVHALGQVAHTDIAKPVVADKLRDALNAHLRPEPIAVLHAEEVASDFHARFDATARHYLYRIVNRRSPLTLDRGHAWQVQIALDAEAMHQAARHLIGNHDFTTFRAAECQAKSPVKTLDRFDASRRGEEIVIDASARSFLHHQVRSMVGSLKLVGEGKWRPSDMKRALDARERSACGPVAPADGLYLVRVDYGARSTSST